MDWNSITVQQFQDINRLADMDEFDKSAKIICILYNKTEAQVDDMELTDFNKLAAECAAVLKQDIPGEPKKVIRANGKKYAINYKPSTLKHRQYVELNYFAEDKKVIENLHLLMASIVQPVKWFRALPNDVNQHEVYASDMLNAKIVDVYSTCVFFCKLLRDSIEAGRGYLAQEMMGKGATMEQANELLTLSISAMDGFIPPKK